MLIKIRDILNKLARLNGYKSDDDRQEAIDASLRMIEYSFGLERYEEGYRDGRQNALDDLENMK